MPAYNAPTVGTWYTNTDGSALSVTAPASVTGKLLLLVACCRTAASSFTSLAPDWTQLAAYTSRGTVEIWGRIGDDTSADDPTVDAVAADDTHAVILAYDGDVYTDMATIVAHSSTLDVSTANLPLAPVTSTTVDNCLVFAVGRHHKTATSNDATVISHAALTMRAQAIATGVSQTIGIADLQQTTATDFDGTDMTINGTAEATNSNGIVLYLKTAAATGHPAGSRTRGVPGMNSIASPFGRGW